MLEGRLANAAEGVVFALFVLLLFYIVGLKLAKT